MFGFGGGFNGPGGNSSNSGSAPSGTNRSDTGRESTQSNNTNRSAPAGSKEKSTSGGVGARSGSAGAAPSANRSDPNRSTAAPSNANRSSPATSGVSVNRSDPNRETSANLGQSVGRGMGAGLGNAVSRAAATRAGVGQTPGGMPPNRGMEDASMSALDRMRSTDMAEARRADENRSVGMYNAAAANSALNADRADAASTVRAAENMSMADLDSLKQSYRDAIAHIETRGIDDPYSAIGNLTKTGDRAHGKYQMMGANIPSWTKQVLGKSMTPKEFRADPAAQDAVFDSIFGGYVAKHGFENAAQAWFGGENSIGKTSRKDVNGMSVGTYGKTFDRVQQASYEARKNDTRFASTYMDPKAKEKDYFGSVPDNQWPGNLEVAARNAGPAESGDTAPPQQASVKSEVDPSLTEFPERPRSMGENVVATGIDIGAGMIPGIGMGIGLINGGLALTGNRTLGEHIVDAIATGDGKYTPGDPGDPSRPTKPKDETTTVVASAPTAPATAFADRYLAFVDNTKRPTPAEKWGTNAPYSL